MKPLWKPSEQVAHFKDRQTGDPGAGIDFARSLCSPPSKDRGSIWRRVRDLRQVCFGRRQFAGMPNEDESSATQLETVSVFSAHLALVLGPTRDQKTVCYDR